MTPTILELQALFALLYSVFRHDTVWVVKLKTGGTPKLYPKARAVLATLYKTHDGKYDHKTQTHTYLLDPQPEIQKWADHVLEQAAPEQANVPSSSPYLALTGALRQGRQDNNPARIKPDKPAEILSAVEVGFGDSKTKKLEIWLGDTPVGDLVQGSNKECYSAYIGKVKVATLSPLITAVLTLLTASKIPSSEYERVHELIMPDGSIVLLKGSTKDQSEPVAANANEPASNSEAAKPTPTTEEKPKLEVAKLGDLEPINSEFGKVITQTEMILLETISADPGLQTRAEIDQELVAEYAEKLRQGIELKPVEVWLEGKTYRLVDGFHRFEAHKKLEHQWINAEVNHGDQRAAFFAALQSNQGHGKRPTPADKRHKIRMALKDPEVCDYSDRRIAELLDVDGKTVASEREKLEGEATIKTSSTRTSATGASVPARKTKAAPASSPDKPLNLGPQSEPKPSLEHGSTQRDQRRVFKGVQMSETIKVEGFTTRGFALVEIGAETPEGMTVIGYRADANLYFSDLKKAKGGYYHPLEAKSWTGAVIEHLGMQGVVSADLVITWVNLDGETIPCPDIKTIKAQDSSTEPSTGSEKPVAKVSKHINATLDALTELRAECSPRDIFDALEQHPSLADLYRDLLLGATKIVADMSDALEREGLAVS
jgi:hypothetical protein